MQDRRIGQHKEKKGSVSIAEYGDEGQDAFVHNKFGAVQAIRVNFSRYLVISS